MNLYTQDKDMEMYTIQLRTILNSFSITLAPCYHSENKKQVISKPIKDMVKVIIKISGIGNPQMI